jgi:hypothetical protein
MKTYQQFVLEARRHNPPYGWKSSGGGPDDKPTVKIPLSGVMQGGWLEKEKAKKKVEEELEIEEGMTLKDYKKKRSALKQKEKRAADKIAPNRRKDIHTDRYSPERAARHRANVDPDFEGNDERNYPGGKLNPKKVRKAKALGELGEELVNETSLTRIMSKSKKGGMAIMSAQRGDKSKAENKARSKQLEKDVRGAGLPGPTKVAGRYTENPGTSQEKKVGEKSHVITPGKKGKRKFKKAIEKLGQKYNQDSVLIQRKAGGSSTLKGTSKTSWPGKGKNVKIGSMKPGRTGEFDTKVKNKTFTVED